MKPNSASEHRRIVYGPDDLIGWEYGQAVGDPGNYPFGRGIHPEGYRGRLWTMRQYSGFGTAEESNLRYRALLEQGTTGLSVAFDLPTQIGLDSDHPLAEGEVGRVGVAIDGLADMDELFEGIPLEDVSTSMTINSTAAILTALYLVVAERRGIGWDRLRGTVQNDVLKEYLARGTFIFPPRPSLRLVTDLIVFAARHLPKWNAISVSGYHIREAGSSAVQELAFTLANGETYLQAIVDSGIEVDEVAPRFSFFFSAHNDLFEEVAKFRAARIVWARLMKERFGAQSERSMRLRFHTQTAGSTLTATQPDNNVVRVAFQALAAVLGGTQSLHTNGRDEALALPTEASAVLALRTQQIIAHESGVAEAVDPLGGSWLVERLTADLVDETESCLDRIRREGGMLTAIESGFPQREIQQTAFDQQRALERGERKVVGVNCYSGPAAPIEISRHDPRLEMKQQERLGALRRARSATAVGNALDGVRRSARGGENLMPTLVEAVRAKATVGEISDALREVFGEHREISLD